MKTKQEQIEEMAKAMYLNCFCLHDHCETCHYVEKCNQNHFAKNAYNMGYRKASDVIDEFVERLNKDWLEVQTKEYGKFYAVSEERILELADEMRQEVEK